MAGKWLLAQRRINCWQCSARRIFAASDPHGRRLRCAL